MRSARKQFEDLGYTQFTHSEKTIGYELDFLSLKDKIIFFLETKEVYISATHLKYPVVQAIDFQCRELGWY